MSLMQMTRITISGFWVSAALALLGLLANEVTAQDLRIMAPRAYLLDIWRQPFERDTGCQIHRVELPSHDEVFAAHAANPGQVSYDLVLLNSRHARTWFDAGMIVSLPKDVWVERFPEPFRDISANLNDNRNFLGVPFSWLTLGIIMDGKRTRRAAIVEDQMRPGADGGIFLVPEDATMTLAFFARQLGAENPYAPTAEEKAVIEARLIPLAPRIEPFDSLPTAIARWQSRDVSMMLGSRADLLAVFGEASGQIRRAIPDGWNIGRLTMWGLAPQPRDAECANAWLRFMAEPEVGDIIFKFFPFIGIAASANARDKLGNLDEVIWERPFQDPAWAEKAWARFLRLSVPE